MDWKKTEQLLEKWYDGQTTPEEEQELKRLLRRPNLPESLIPHRELLLGLDEASDLQLADPGFDDRVFDAIEKQEQSRSTSIRTLWRLSAAALMIIALTFLAVWFTSRPDELSSQTAYTEEQIQQAGEITDTTLVLISELLNSGRKELTRVSVMQENLEKLEYLSAVNRGIKKLEIISNQDHSQSNQKIES